MLVKTSEPAKNAKNRLIWPFMTSQNDVRASNFSKWFHNEWRASF